MFQSHPWHERVSSSGTAATLAGLPIPSDWPADDLPPFPFSHSKAHELSPAAWEVIDRIEVIYRAAALLEFRASLSRGESPGLRNVAAALARLCSLAETPTELCVLSRLLEQEVFLLGGVLTVNVAAVVEVLRLHQQPSPSRDRSPEARHWNPEVAAAAVVDSYVAARRSEPREDYDVALDGTHVVGQDSTRIEVPWWSRWPLRAAGRASQRKRRATAGGSSRPDIRLYTLLRGAAHSSGSANRADSEPLTSALAETISLYEQAGEAPDDSAAPTIFPAAAARAAWRLGTTRADVDTTSSPTKDEDTDWLVEHGLAKHDGEGPNVRLAPWLLDAIRDYRTGFHVGFRRIYAFDRHRALPKTASAEVDDSPESRDYYELGTALWAPVGFVHGTLGRPDEDYLRRVGNP